MQYLRGDRKKKTATALQCYPSRAPFYSREIAKNSTSCNRGATINFDLTLDIVKFGKIFGQHWVPSLWSRMPLLTFLV